MADRSLAWGFVTSERKMKRADLLNSGLIKLPEMKLCGDCGLQEGPIKSSISGTSFQKRYSIVLTMFGLREPEKAREGFRFVPAIIAVSPGRCWLLSLCLPQISPVRIWIFSQFFVRRVSPGIRPICTRDDRGEWAQERNQFVSAMIAANKSGKIETIFAVFAVNESGKETD